MLPKLQKEQKNRRYSWPPFKTSITDHKKDIDEDPFSFFISSPHEDSAEVSQAHMDADIERDARARSLSPRMRRNRDKLLQGPVINRLRRWMQRMETRYLHKNYSNQVMERLSLPTPPDSPTRLQVVGIKRPAPFQEDSEPMLDIYDIAVSPPLRGRRPTRSSRRRYGDRVIRSHSKKARVWREPGEDIWPVLEEESEDIGLGIKV